MLGRATKAIKLSVTKDLKPLLAGQCILDQLNHRDKHVLPEGLHLSYNRMKGLTHLSHDKPALGEDWMTYDKIPFEHSDTCPSRIYRERAETGQEVQPMDQQVKMAVCCYVMDKNKNVMLTKRPDHLKIFPSVWVMPGGMVEYQETLELGLFRELEEEVGLTFEYRNEETNSGGVRMISPLHFDHPDEIPLTFEPFYLYESVTRGVLDQVEHLSGYKDRPEDLEERESKPPPSQHLVLFFKAQIDESFDRLMVELNKAEVQKLVWASLPQLDDAFKGKHSNLL